MNARFSRHQAGEAAPDEHFILATKLHPPDTHSELVLRSSLIEQLDSGIQHRLILVCAPAGFGKTTLLSTWRPTFAGTQLPVAWVSLDKHDNDPARFWAYVAGALRMLLDTDDKALHSALPPAAPARIETHIGDIINDWVSRNQHAVLILDDYHVITSSSIHEELQYLLEHLPPRLHLVLSSRTLPPIPLARLRAEGGLYELGLAQLRFSQAEIAQFIELFPDLSLPAESRAILATASEGWVAALRLALIALRAGSHLPDVPVTISGRHQYIFDYLAEEVFQQQSPAVQSFLLNTSILDRLCAPLCDAVTGMANGRAMLGLLEHVNLFMQPLDTERHWYRYHNLFAEFLHARLEHGSAEQAVELHMRASRWLERSSMPEQAIDHAFAAGDFAHAARLISSVAEVTLQRGELASLRRWLVALPAPIIRASPGLCIWVAWVHVLGGHPPEAEPYLRQAEAGLCEPGQQTLEDCDPVADIDMALVQVAVIRSFVAQNTGDVPGTLRYSEQALRLLGTASQDNPTMRALILLNLGAAHVEQGERAQAMDEFQQAEQISTANGEVYNAFGASDYLASLFIQQGDLPQAATVYSQAIKRFAGGPGKPVPAARMLYIGLGDLHYQQNRLDSALEYLVQGLHACEEGGSFAMRLRGQIALARTQVALGDIEAALRLLDQAAEAIQQQNTLPEIASIRQWQMRIQIRLGNPALASQWAAEYDPEQQNASSRELSIGTLVRVSLATGGGARWYELLIRMQQEAEHSGRAGSLLEFLMLEALLLQAQGKISTAVSRLERALNIASKGGYVRIFLDEGPPMFELLSAALDRQRRQPRRFSAPDEKQNYHYAGLLLAAFRAEQSSLLTSPSSAGQERQLTRREKEVLRLLAARLPYHDIATALVIAEDTAKWHIKNIYRKLQVTDRNHLIERVRDLDLLA